MVLNAPRELDGEAAMDPYAKYNQFKRLIDEYDRSIDSARKANPELSKQLESSLFGRSEGTPGSQRSLLACTRKQAEQLKRLRDATKASVSAVAGNPELVELEQGYYAALGDYESAVRVLDQSWAAYPPAFKQEGTVFPVYYTGKKAGYLAAGGNWKAAETVLSGLKLGRNENSTFDVDFIIGLRALVHAVLGEPSRYLPEFARMERKYRALSANRSWLLLCRGPNHHLQPSGLDYGQ